MYPQGCEVCARLCDYVRSGDWYAQMPLAAGVGWRRSLSPGAAFFNLHTRFVSVAGCPHHFTPMTMRPDPQVK